MLSPEARKELASEILDAITKSAQANPGATMADVLGVMKRVETALENAFIRNTMIDAFGDGPLIRSMLP